MLRTPTFVLRTLTLAIGAACFATVAQAQNIGIAVSNPGSLYHSIGTAVAKVANEAGLKTTIQPATAPTQYLPVVGTGDIEIGLCNLQECARPHSASRSSPAAPVRTFGYWACCFL